VKSREINDAYNSQAEENNFYDSIIIANCLKCDIRTTCISIMELRKNGCHFAMFNSDA